MSKIPTLTESIAGGNPKLKQPYMSRVNATVDIMDWIVNLNFNFLFIWFAHFSYTLDEGKTIVILI